MQKDLGLKVIKTVLDDEEMRYAMKVRLSKVIENEENYMWFTNWAIILKEENVIIGYIILKGLPNESGEVIIGYDIEEKHRCNGYATEAVSNINQWIFSNPKVLSVIADTEKMNIPSCQLLKHLGAVQYMETEELVWWRLVRNK